MGDDALRFRCELCDSTVHAATAGELKDQGRSHLEETHSTELSEEFRGRIAGESCYNDCGYVFPEAIEEVSGLSCPSCNHSHFESLVQQHLYWRIESR